MNYHNITKDDMLNGDGLRVVLWVAGCEHHCYECQNPITWNPENGLLFDKKAEEEIFKELKKPYISGITFSGGDPLHYSNVSEVLDLIIKIKEKYPNKTIWLYTGYKFEDIMLWTNTPTINPSMFDNKNSVRRDVIKHIDVLVDGIYVKELRDTKLHWRGSCNQHVIDVQKSLKEGKFILWDK